MVKKYDMNYEGVGNKDKRAEWLNEHKNLIEDFPQQIKFILVMLYHIREFSNLTSKLKILGLTFQTICRYMKLIEEAGLVSCTQYGIHTRYRITPSGDKYCIKLFDKFRSEIK